MQYDVASLLYDAKADLPPQLRQQLLYHYLDALGGFIPLERAAFLQHYYAFVYVRLMQAMGAYGFRGFYERKAHFLQSVPYALKNLRWLLHNVELPVPLPTLMEAFRSMLASEKLQSLSPDAGASEKPSPSAKPLTVRVSSFSFHRGGPPSDESGNGGGFVFDARSLPNPGREDRFKPLTGKDAPVIEYLDQQDYLRQFSKDPFARLFNKPESAPLRERRLRAIEPNEPSLPDESMRRSSPQKELNNCILGHRDVEAAAKAIAADVVRRREDLEGVPLLIFPAQLYAQPQSDARFDPAIFAGAAQDFQKSSLQQIKINGLLKISFCAERIAKVLIEGFRRS